MPQEHSLTLIKFGLKQAGGLVICQESPGRKARAPWHIPDSSSSAISCLSTFSKPNSTSKQGSQDMAAQRAALAVGGGRSHFPKRNVSKQKLTLEAAKR